MEYLLKLHVDIYLVRVERNEGIINEFFVNVSLIYTLCHHHNKYSKLKSEDKVMILSPETVRIYISNQIIVYVKVEVIVFIQNMSLQCIRIFRY